MSKNTNDITCGISLREFSKQTFKAIANGNSVDGTPSLTEYADASGLVNDIVATTFAKKLNVDATALADSLSDNTKAQQIIKSAVDTARQSQGISPRKLICA